jgi:4-hydroxybenzoate polyprenyltransferase/phosphoserine phosphatase
VTSSDSPRDPPLCVDLDGTLLRTDSLHELCVTLLAKRPLDVLRLPGWLLRGGRAHLKARLTERVALKPSRLPYRSEVVDAVRASAAAGRRTILVTAADQAVADGIAAHVGGFTEVLGSDGANNLKGERKATLLVDRFGRGGFEYIGDSSADLPVWEAAEGALLAAPSASLQQRVAARVPVRRTFGARPSARERLRAWLRALRVHQWAKNLLVLLPIVAAHRVQDASLAGLAALAFVSFCLLSSAVYLFNDIVDLDADRGHPTKCRRPFASGLLPLWSGVVAAPLLGGAAFVVAALTLPPAFVAVLALYVLANGVYSLGLKRVAVADVLLLAALYVLRVVAGGVAVGVLLSPWLLAFCLFFFLNLAFLKRYVELGRMSGSAETVAAGRGYRAADLDLLRSLGPSAGYLAVAVLALYIQSQAVTELYGRPWLLWLAAPLAIFWITRVWLFAHRGEMHDDPVLFALRDRTTWVVAALGGVLGVLAAAPL